jgi:hypothetical protein
LVVHQPSAPLLADLSKWMPKHVVSRLDLAFDFIMPDLKSASTLQSFLRQHMTQSWHGKRRMTDFDTTVYFSGAWQRRGGGIYSNRNSKKCDSPATHFELRFYGSEVCRSYGAATIDDLCNLDHFKILSRNYRLSSCVWPMFDRVIDELVSESLRNQNRSGRKIADRDQMTTRMWKILARATQGPEGALAREQMAMVPMQQWLEVVPHQQRWTVKIPIESILIKNRESHI